MLTTEVELFRNDAAASAYLSKEADGIADGRGRIFQGVRIADVDRFDVDDLGDEAHGITATMVRGDVAMFVTTVGFRRGRIVGWAGIARTQELESTGEMARIAGDLDDRIGRVLAGEIDEPAVRVRKGNRPATGPNLRKLTLKASDFSLRMSATHSDYVRRPGVDAYFREFESLPPVRLGDSAILYLRTVTGLFATARQAEADERLLTSPAGSRSVVRSFLDGFFRLTDFRPRRVDTRPLSAPTGDTAALEFSLDVPNGRLRGVLVSVQRGRLTASALAIGREAEVNPRDILPLHTKLRTQINGG